MNIKTIKSVAFSKNQTRAKAFSLIELLVVVIILGVLAAMIVPQFLGTTQEAKVSAAKANISLLESALERFNLHMDRYPTTEEGLNALVEKPASDEGKWKGPYITVLRQDPWNQPFQYRQPGVRSKGRFDVWSRGAGGTDGGEGDAADVGNW